MGTLKLCDFHGLHLAEDTDLLCPRIYQPFLGFLFFPPFLPPFLGEESRKDKFKTQQHPCNSSLPSILGRFSNLRIQKKPDKSDYIFPIPSVPSPSGLSKWKIFDCFSAVKTFSGLWAFETGIVPWS